MGPRAPGARRARATASAAATAPRAGGGRAEGAGGPGGRLRRAPSTVTWIFAVSTRFQRRSLVKVRARLVAFTLLMVVMVHHLRLHLVGGCSLLWLVVASGPGLGVGVG